eukprot:277762_1
MAFWYIISLIAVLLVPINAEIASENAINCSSEAVNCTIDCGYPYQYCDNKTIIATETLSLYVNCSQECNNVTIFCPNFDNSSSIAHPTFCKVDAGRYGALNIYANFTDLINITLTKTCGFYSWEKPYCIKISATNSKSILITENMSTQSIDMALKQLYAENATNVTINCYSSFFSWNPLMINYTETFLLNDLSGNCPWFYNYIYGANANAITLTTHFSTFYADDPFGTIFAPNVSTLVINAMSTTVGMSDGSNCMNITATFANNIYLNCINISPDQYRYPYACYLINLFAQHVQTTTSLNCYGQNSCMYLNINGSNSNELIVNATAQYSLNFGYIDGHNANSMQIFSDSNNSNQSVMFQDSLNGLSDDNYNCLIYTSKNTSIICNGIRSCDENMVLNTINGLSDVNFTFYPQCECTTNDTFNDANDPNCPNNYQYKCLGSLSWPWRDWFSIKVFCDKYNDEEQYDEFLYVCGPEKGTGKCVTDSDYHKVDAYCPAVPVQNKFWSTYKYWIIAFVIVVIAVLFYCVWRKCNRKVRSKKHDEKTSHLIQNSE